MDLGPQRRLAANIMKVGTNRVWMDPLREADISDAITRQDVRGLIASGLIRVKQKEGTSRHRARERHEKRRSGARRGYGKRKGKFTAKIPKKRQWINKVRPMRRLLRHLRDKELMDRNTFSTLYRQVKGNFFRSKAHLKLYIKKHKLTKGEK